MQNKIGELEPLDVMRGKLEENYRDGLDSFFNAVEGNDNLLGVAESVKTNSNDLEQSMETGIEDIEKDAKQIEEEYKASAKKLTTFANNMHEGINYYQKMFNSIGHTFIDTKESITDSLNDAMKRIKEMREEISILILENQK